MSALPSNSHSFAAELAAAVYGPGPGPSLYVPETELEPPADLDAPPPWQPEPADLDPAGWMTLDQWLDHQAENYREHVPGPLGAFVADRLAELAGLARYTLAATPDQLAERIDQLDAAPRVCRHCRAGFIHAECDHCGRTPLDA